jgi:ankyrin repeat protein
MIFVFDQIMNVVSLSAPDEDGDTPLQIAAAQWGTDCLEILLLAGANSYERT